MQKTFQTILASCFLVFSLLTVAGCNTVRGVGQDVEAAGEAIESEAEEATTY